MSKPPLADKRPKIEAPEPATPCKPLPIVVLHALERMLEAFDMPDRWCHQHEADALSVARAAIADAKREPGP